MTSDVRTSHPPAILTLRLALAGVSATIAQVACQPIETVKIRLQLRDRTRFRDYTSFSTGLRHLLRSEGALALWKGMAPSAAREMPYSSLRYGLFLPIQVGFG